MPLYNIIFFVHCFYNIYGGIAQVARAFGSYPKRHWFKSNYRYHIAQCTILVFIIFYTWPGGQAVKTPPFHGGNTGSIPVRVTINNYFFISKV